MAGGYSFIAWSPQGGNKDDKEVIVFSLTNEMRVFRPNDPSFAVFHHWTFGPTFNNALAVRDLTMNGENFGKCRVKDSQSDHAKYCEETDTQGKSLLDRLML